MSTSAAYPLVLVSSRSDKEWSEGRSVLVVSSVLLVVVVVVIAEVVAGMPWSLLHLAVRKSWSSLFLCEFYVLFLVGPRFDKNPHPFDTSHMVIAT